MVSDKRIRKGVGDKNISERNTRMAFRVTR